MEVSLYLYYNTFCILWFGPKKDLWNAKKLKLYRDSVTIFVLLLALQNEALNDMLCLGSNPTQRQKELKFFRFPRDAV
jgi:fucose 4-O-acetylase-like acetyltransferase